MCEQMTIFQSMGINDQVDYSVDIRQNKVREAKLAFVRRAMVEDLIDMEATEIEQLVAATQYLSAAINAWLELQTEQTIDQYVSEAEQAVLKSKGSPS